MISNEYGMSCDLQSAIALYVAGKLFVKVKECDDIKQELEISKRRRPMWDEKFLQEIGFESCKIDCEISGRVYKIKDDFYNPTPMFKVCAIKSR